MVPDRIGCAPRCRGNLPIAKHRSGRTDLRKPANVVRDEPDPENECVAAHYLATPGIHVADTKSAERRSCLGVPSSRQEDRPER